MLDQLGFLPTKFSEVEPLALGALLGGLGSSNSLRPVRAAGQAKARGNPGKSRSSQVRPGHTGRPAVGRIQSGANR